MFPLAGQEDELEVILHTSGADYFIDIGAAEILQQNYSGSK
jgi:hypothetical protein